MPFANTAYTPGTSELDDYFQEPEHLLTFQLVDSDQRKCSVRVNAGTAYPLESEILALADSIGKISNAAITGVTVTVSYAILPSEQEEPLREIHASGSTLLRLVGSFDGVLGTAPGEVLEIPAPVDGLAPAGSTIVDLDATVGAASVQSVVSAWVTIPGWLSAGFKRAYITQRSARGADGRL